LDYPVVQLGADNLNFVSLIKRGAERVFIFIGTVPRHN